MFGYLATLVLAAMTVVQAQAIPPNCTRNGTAIQDDTCFKMSARYNVSSYQLAYVNEGIIDPECSNLKPGWVYCLGLQGQDCLETYTIGDGDICDAIITKFGIQPSGTFYNNNPQIHSDCSNLIIGEVVCVSNTAYPYPDS